MRETKDSQVINQIRLPLIILVTYAHSYGAIRSGYSLLTSGWDTLEVTKLLVSQTLTKVVVPVFFIISGYLFFRHLETWNWTLWRQKLLRRLRTLLLPYVVWNLLMAVKLKTFSWPMLWAYWSEAGTQTDWLGAVHHMTAPCNMPLWFLRDLMVITLLTPLLYPLLRRYGKPLVGLLTLWYLSGVCPFPLPGLSAYAICFFSMGALLTIHRCPLTATAMRVELPAYILSAMLAVAMLFSWHIPLFSPFMLAFRLTGAVAVFCIASRLSSPFTLHPSPFISHSSYFLYLSHYVFFLSFIDNWMLSLPHAFTLHPSPFTILHYLLAPLVKAVLLLAVYVGCYKLFHLCRKQEK